MTVETVFYPCLPCVFFFIIFIFNNMHECVSVLGYVSMSEDKNTRVVCVTH